MFVGCAAVSTGSDSAAHARILGTRLASAKLGRPEQQMPSRQITSYYAGVVVHRYVRVLVAECSCAAIPEHFDAFMIYDVP